ncbi:Hypothetical protein PBC10988_27300 [Planctomycetales bacterium 10988]|nr:Hypothetical protein PBC10988_27300 [Planctomycetales bacterium 10988]
MQESSTSPPAALDPAIFAELQTTMEKDGPQAVFSTLKERLSSQKKYHELFDVYLMETRHQLNLPLIMTQSLDEMDEAIVGKVEEAYLEACRVVGDLLLQENKLREAWMYLRPAAAKQKVADYLQQNEPDEEDLEDWIQIAVREGVDPERGFALALEHLGTCNCVTMFDSETYHLPAEQREAIAAMLARHLHEELKSTLFAEIAREEGSEPPEQPWKVLLEERDWLFMDDAYHIDISHLGMVVKFGRLVKAKEPLLILQDLAEYGRRLSSQYQYGSEAPFDDLYADHARFFEAQLGENVEENLAFFAKQAAEREPHQEGWLVVEAYIALLCRLGRYEKAFEEHRDRIPSGVRLSGLAPTLMELAQLSGRYDQLREVCKDRRDLVGFTAGLLQEKLTKNEAG